MKSKEKKPCKLCPSPRYANISWCFKHYREREKKKRMEKVEKALARKVKTKKYQQSERKKLHRQCWKLMSEKVRQMGMDKFGYNHCYTCNKRLHWKSLHAGHFQHGKLDFDERNLKPQCTLCNTYQGGQLDAYAIRLVEEYSLAWVNQLRKDAARHLGYSMEDLKEIYSQLSGKEI